MREAEAYHHDLEELLPRIVAQHCLGAAHDTAAVLRHRVEEAAGSPPRTRSSQRPRLIAGLIPDALAPMDAEHRDALDQRKKLIEARAHELAVAAVDSKAPWVRRLGTQPADSSANAMWLTGLTTVAAYRDRYEVTSAQPLGGSARTDAQRRQRRSALGAARQAQQLTAGSRTPDAQPLGAGPVAHTGL